MNSNIKSKYSQMSFKENGLELERAVGISTVSNNGISSCPKSGDIFYSSGCVVVRYSSSLNKQVQFYTTARAVSCLTVSKNGDFLAVGERGHLPNCVIFDVASGLEVASLSGHKNGIGCLTFSPSGNLLVSIGFKLDRQLIVWDVKSQSKIITQKLGNKVYGVSFHPGGKYFVTCGDRHLKFWSISTSPAGSIEVTGRPASILEDHKDAVFMDVCCGMDHYEGKVFCTTSTGVLCTFNESMMLERWMQIESQASYCITLLNSSGTRGLLVVGCSSGITRAFSADSLQYVCTLPLPSPISEDASVPQFPACYACCHVQTDRPGDSPMLATVYADRSLFVWAISDVFNATIYRSNVFHRACIWDLCFINELYDDAEGDVSKTFVTCSSDSTIRFWNLDAEQQQRSTRYSFYSREMLHVLEMDNLLPNDGNTAPVSRLRTGGGIAAAVAASAAHGHRGQVGSSISSVLSTGTTSTSDTAPGISATAMYSSPPSSSFSLVDGIPDPELPDRPNSAAAPRCLSVHPNSVELACGDRGGKLRIIDIRTMNCIQSIQAHSAEILTLSFSPFLKELEDGTWTVDSESSADSLVLLATAGRDRLIHIFEASASLNGRALCYSPLCTLDYHSSSVTVVKFSPDGQRFISCGGDHTMVFSSVHGRSITRLKSIQTPHGTINSLSIEATNKFAVTSGQDKRLNIWNLQTGKHMRAYKNEAISGELYKTDIDPSGMFIAVCSFDKCISIFDFFSGEMVAQCAGHSELITSLKFAPDGQTLVSVGGDGCILVWSLSAALVSAMQERMVELYSSAQRRQHRLSKQVEAVQAHSMPAPPPPPPSHHHHSVLANSAMAESKDSMHASRTLSPKRLKLGAKKVSGTTLTDDVATEPSEPVEPKGVASRWAQRAPAEGYELFGRKVIPGSASRRNEFTVEMSKTAIGGTDTSSDNIDWALGINEQASHTARGSTVLAIGHEASDGVMLRGSDDEDDFEFEDGDGDQLFKPQQEAHEEADVSDDKGIAVPGAVAARPLLSEPSSDDEADLDKTSSHLDSLDKSAASIETWLEEMIRSEGKLTGDSHIPVIPDESGASDLRQSLSAAFFDRGKRENPVGQDSGDPSSSTAALPPPPPVHHQSLPLPPTLAANESHDPVSSVRSSLPNNDSIESKRRETAAAVSQMKERLKGMGIWKKDFRQPPAQQQSEASPSPAPTNNASPPPLPSVHSSEEAALQLLTDKCRATLREFTALRNSMLDSFDALLQSRSLIAAQLQEPRPPSGTASASLPSCVSDADAVLEDWQTSVSSFANTIQLQEQRSFTSRPYASRRQTSSESGIGSSVDSMSLLGANQSTILGPDLSTSSNRNLPSEDEALAAVLERYSDRLADLVSEKVARRLESSMNTSLGSLRTDTVRDV